MRPLLRRAGEGVPRTRMTSVKQLTWLVPFASAGLIALALFRPAPLFPTPAKSRIVIDASGTAVSIAIPYRGTVLTLCGFQYLESTHAPETLLHFQEDRTNFGKTVMSWIYPELEKNDSLWDEILPHSHGPYVGVEKLLALDVGAYVGGCGNYGQLPLLRQAGLPAVFSSSLKEKNWDEAFVPWRGSMPD